MFEESTLKRNSLPSTVTGEIVWHLIEISPDHFAKLSLPARLPFNSEMRSVGRVSSFGSVLVRQPPQKNSYFTRALKRSIQAFIIYTSSSKLSNNRNCLFPISTHNLILVQKWMQMSQCSVTINSTFNGFSVSDPLLLKAARNMESPWFDLGHPKAAVKRNCNAGGGRMQRTFLKPVTGLLPLLPVTTVNASDITGLAAVHGLTAAARPILQEEMRELEKWTIFGQSLMNYRFSDG